MKSLIDRIKGQIAELEAGEPGDVFGFIERSDSNPDVEIILRTPAVKLLASILPDKTVELQNQYVRLGRLLSINDVESCLAFDATRMYGSDSDENKDLVRNRILPFFVDEGGSYCCVSVDDFGENSDVSFVEHGYIWENVSDLDERIRSARKIPAKFGNFFSFLVQFRGDVLIEDDPPGDSN